MFVWATQKLWSLTLRIAFYVALFMGVVVLQVAVLSALRQMGWAPGPALGVSGAVVLAAVLAGHFALRYRAGLEAKKLDRKRATLGLPHGPCCVVWAAGPGDDIPWDVEGQFQLDYPEVAQRLKIEGVAVVEFQVDPEGRAKNIHCVDVWPAPVFYEAAVAALRAARFRPASARGLRFGPSYRVPFVFRIRGASRRRDTGQRVRANAHTVGGRLADLAASRFTKRQSS
jgi:TonB family protein